MNAPAPAHTPGPWKGNGTLIESDAPSYIASVNYAGSVEETRANARLIAAAPELLAALERIAYAPFGRAEATHAEVLDDITRLARAALDRVRGETK